MLSRTRRDFIRTTAAAVGAAVLPFGTLRAQDPRTRVRWNVTDPRAAQSLASYKKAVRAMLALPPSDPRNWYRHTLIHTLDCPHGNWWFLPWHRGYIGWFEQTCRDLSGDPDFAIPYWDWTVSLDPRTFKPGIPPLLFDDVLSPANASFIGAYEDFETVFRDVIAGAGYWKSAGPFDPKTQYGALLARGVRFNDDLWFDIASDPRGRYFYERAHARGLTPSHPYFDEETAAAVSLDNLHAALAPDDFISFASAKAPNHSANRGFAPLEAGPHNLVHNNVGGVTTIAGPDGKPVTTNTGGFMQDLMSPVDPIFFLHHSNMDRLWDVWTRKQQARGLPILPDGYLAGPAVEGTDFYRWSTEPFQFFIDANGGPVTGATAGDYGSIGRFNYEYQPGSGEDVVAMTTTLAVARAAAQVQVFHPAQAGAERAARDAEGFTFAIPAPMLEAQPSHDGPVLIARITVEMPAHRHASRLRLFVNAPAGGDPGTASPHFAGSFAMFSHRSSGTFTFTLPLSKALAALRAANLLDTGAPLVLRVIQEGVSAAHAADVLSMVVEAH